MGFGEPTYSDLDFSPGFESFFGMGGPSDRTLDQCVSLENSVHEQVLKEGLKMIRVLGTLNAPFQLLKRKSPKLLC